MSERRIACPDQKKGSLLRGDGRSVDMQGLYGSFRPRIRVQRVETMDARNLVGEGQILIHAFIHAREAHPPRSAVDCSPVCSYGKDGHLLITWRVRCEENWQSAVRSWPDCATKLEFSISGQERSCQESIFNHHTGDVAGLCCRVKRVIDFSSIEILWERSSSIMVRNVDGLWR